MSKFENHKKAKKVSFLPKHQMWGTINLITVSALESVLKIIVASFD